MEEGMDLIRTKEEFKNIPDFFLFFSFDSSISFVLFLSRCTCNLKIKNEIRGYRVVVGLGFLLLCLFGSF